MRALSVVLLMWVLSSACSSDEQAAPESDPPTAAVPSASDDGAEGSQSETCAQVRAGIEAFNAGDYDETVARFAEAVPLAEAVEDDSATAGLLADAVRYYADLAPDDYPDAAQSSDDFEKYKQVTLTLCVDDETPLREPEDTGVPA